VPAKTTTAIALLLGIVAAPRVAYAESYALAWTSSPEAPCVDPKTLETAIVARLGRNPFVAVDRADVVLRGHDLPQIAARARAVLEQRARDGHVLGTRALESTTCEKLTRSTAFVIVLIVDPDALTRESEPEVRATTETDAEEPKSPRPPRAPPPLLPLPRSRLSSLVSAGAAFTFSRGLLPGGDAGGLVMLGVTPLPLPVRFEWRGSYRASLSSPRDRGFSAIAQEWRACWLVRPHARLSGEACAGGAWAAIFPGTSGLSQGDQSPKAVYGPVLALGPALHLGDYAVVADVSAFVPQPRYLFSYVDDAGRRQRLHELDRVVVSATIGVTRAFF
jgi:hypothetical protein